MDNVIDAADDVSWADSPSEKTAAKAAYAAAEAAAQASIKEAEVDANIRTGAVVTEGLDVVGPNPLPGQ